MLESKRLPIAFCRLLQRFIEETSKDLDAELDFRFYVIESPGFSPDYDFEKFRAIQIDMGGSHSCALGDSAGVEKKLIRDDGEDCCFLYTTARNKRMCPDLAVRFWRYMGRNLLTALSGAEVGA